MLAVLVSACLFAPPTAKAQTTIWSATLTVQEQGFLGCQLSGNPNCASALTEDEFTYKGTSYTVTAVLQDHLVSHQLIFIVADQDLSDVKSALSSLTLNAHDTAFAFKDASVASDGIVWPYDPPTDWVAGQTVQLSLTELVKPTVSLSVSPNPVTEGETVTVTVRLSEPYPFSQGTIPVTVTQDTSETGDHDTDVLNLFITQHSKSSSSGTINTYRDVDWEDETFTVSLGHIGTAFEEGDPSSIQVTIRDVDGPTPSTGTGGGGGGPAPPALSGDATLSALGIQEASLDFDPDTYAYTLNVYGEETLTLTPRANHPDADITVNGNRVRSGASLPVPLDEDGETAIEIEVTAEDGTTRTYSLTVMSCPGEERGILGMFHEATQGEMWEENRGWRTEDDLRSWYGVRTENGRVTALSLPENRLSGEISQALKCFGGLEELRELNLSDNNGLQGELPRELENLENLRVLDIRCTGIEVPEETEEWTMGLGEGFRGGCTPDDMVSASGDGGCAVGGSREHMKASVLLAAVFMLLAVSRGLRARSD